MGWYCWHCTRPPESHHQIQHWHDDQGHRTPVQRPGVCTSAQDNCTLTCSDDLLPPSEPEWWDTFRNILVLTNLKPLFVFIYINGVIFECPAWRSLFGQSVNNNNVTGSSLVILKKKKVNWVIGHSSLTFPNTDNPSPTHKAIPEQNTSFQITSGVCERCPSLCKAVFMNTHHSLLHFITD